MIIMKVSEDTVIADKPVTKGSWIVIDKDVKVISDSDMRCRLFHPGKKRIMILHAECGFYKSGEIGALSHQDEDGDWWADINGDNWCVGKEGQDFKVLT